jgi:hypothetical protein
MANFIRAANPIWFMVDLTGNALDDSYYLHTLTNTLPYLPQEVYQDNQGLTPWTDPVQFLANGTLPNNLYWNDELVYRLEVRRGALQSDPLIYTINDFAPSNNTTPNENPDVNQDNQISNSFFSSVNFGFITGTSTPSLSITSSGTYHIAPGWDLVLTGSGTTTITQLIYSGDQNLSGSPVPPYAISIDNNGWSSAILYQRFNGVGAIWSNTFVSMSVLARSGDSVARPLTLVYYPNSPGTPVTITSDTLNTGNYEIIQGVIALPVSTNTSLNDVAYVDMQIVLPGTGIVELSDVQVMGQNSQIPLDFSQTPEETPERIKDHLFHYYADELITKPKKSILTGWNFSLNPFQFYPTAMTTATSQTQYICDQTIIHQEAASRVQTGKSEAMERFGLKIRAINGATNNRFALIQYIDPKTCRPYWGKILSSLAKARIFTTHGTQVRIKMRLITSANLPATISNTEPISSWPANSDPIFSGAWSALVPLNDPAYILPNAYDTSQGEEAYEGFSFDQFQLTACSGVNNTIGIVIYTMDEMDDSSGTEDYIVFDSVSLVDNKFAVAAEPQTFDEALRECQYFYEKSYDNGSLAGTDTTNGLRYFLQLAESSSPINAIPRSFNIEFNTIKRTSTPTILLYSKTGAVNNVSVTISNGGSTGSFSDVSTGAWTLSWIGEKSSVWIPNSVTTIDSLAQVSNSPEAFLGLHYVIDSRLGI